MGADTLRHQCPEAVDAWNEFVCLQERMPADRDIVDGDKDLAEPNEPT